MPRCQWCRQESATSDVCEWCKRPLAAGWTPAAAGPAVAVAAPMPHDRMTFVQDDDSGKNDRILVFSMLGIVFVTAIAFAVNYFTKKDAPMPVTPPAISAPQEPQPSPVSTSSPTPAITPPVQENATVYQAPAPPVEQPVYQQPPVQPSDDFSNSPGMQNPKLRGLRDITNQN